MAALCGGGSLAGYVLYDKATTPDRSTPTLVVRQYVNAYLGQRDDERAALFACGGNPDLPALRAARDDVVSRERQHGVAIAITIDSVRETSRTGIDAQVEARIVLTAVIDGSSQRAVEQWSFLARDENGWRVCDGHELG